MVNVEPDSENAVDLQLTAHIGFIPQHQRGRPVTESGQKRAQGPFRRTEAGLQTGPNCRCGNCHEVNRSQTG